MNCTAATAFQLELYNIKHSRNLYKLIDRTRHGVKIMFQSAKVILAKNDRYIFFFFFKVTWNQLLFSRRRNEKQMNVVLFISIQFNLKSLLRISSSFDLK